MSANQKRGMDAPFDENILIDRLVECLEDKKIKEYDDEELYQKVSRAIVMAYSIVGYQNYNPKDLSFLVGVIGRELRERYFYLTFEEVAFAFEQGAKGYFGEFKGITVHNFIRWIQKYRVSEARMSAQNRKKIYVLTSITETRNTAQFKQLVLYVYNRFKQGHPLRNERAGYVYLEMQRRGWICDSLEVKLQAIEEVKDCFEDYYPTEFIVIPYDKYNLHRAAMIILLEQHFLSWIEIEKVKRAQGEDLDKYDDLISLFI